MTETNAPPMVAALDLGSNSFHLLIARIVDDRPETVDRLRDPVCLASGLDDDGRLTPEMQERALLSLQRIGQRIRDLPVGHVRVVGTNTLRSAENASEFLVRAERALGYEIDVIPGVEEARLIDLGVSGRHPGDERRLVVDIGGGSTELVLGGGGRPIDPHSLYMGCVTYSRRFFPGGRLTRDAFREAEVAAAVELRAIRRELRRRGWDRCIGASGTIGAIQQIVVANGWSGEAITLAAMKKLRKAMIAGGETRKLSITGLNSERAQTLPGGLAILIAIVKSLDVERMTGSKGALRDGLIWDLIGRMHHEDERERTIERLSAQYNVDREQAERVETMAIDLLRQLSPERVGDLEFAERVLRQAAALHEIGLAIAYPGHHRHGAYLVSNHTMPGFSSGEQRTLAALIGSHRRKFSPDVLLDVPERRRGIVRLLCVLLRLAVLLHRSRSSSSTPGLTVSDDGRTVDLVFGPGWTERHPLSVTDLRDEAQRLRPHGIELRVSEAADA